MLKLLRVLPVALSLQTHRLKRHAIKGPEKSGLFCVDKESITLLQIGGLGCRRNVSLRFLEKKFVYDTLRQVDLATAETQHRIL